MATATEGSTQLLDQLQKELNGVVEQMARIFMAANENPTTRPVVQGNKLKAMLPAATDNFHTALDQLEHELQLAQLVMRRDLAVCRERLGIAKPARVKETAESSSDAPKPQDSAPSIVDVSNAAEPISAEDVAMEDSLPAQEIEMADVSTETTKPQQTSNELADAEKKDTETAKDTSVDRSATDGTQNTSDPALQIDTETQPKPTTTGEPNQPEDDNPPDTGTFSNPNDLDSLFGPTSAGGGDFNTDPTTNPNPNSMDFDFDSFSAHLGPDNDNITSLLPGLQDYANNQADEAHASDFENLFDINSVPVDPTRQVQGENSFEELLDFEDFAGGEFGGEGGEGGGNGNGEGGAEFDFEFD